jgi:hypothetical protein
MADSKFKRFFRKLVQLMKTMMLAYMVGLANIVKEETRFIEDTPTKIEYKHEVTDDEQIRDVD